MIIKILGLLNIFLTIACFMLLFVNSKANRYKINVIRIILASLVVIVAVIIIINKILVGNVWFFDLMLILIQPLVVKDSIKYLFNASKKNSYYKNSSR